jgi:uncharacterized protein YndB with AHSA1/START domain
MLGDDPQMSFPPCRPDLDRVVRHSAQGRRHGDWHIEMAGRDLDDADFIWL